MKPLSILAGATLLLAVTSAPAGAQARMGSIYDPDRGPRGAIADKTAYRLGDIVTVVVSENQDISNQESSGLSKESSLKYKLTTLDLKPNMFNYLPEIDGGSATDFSGTANYEKKGTFTTRLAAIVVDVLPNGNLVLSGRREIRIDRETKLIEFTGVVRKYDIQADNSIQSELVANADIRYRGSGPLTDHTNRRGLGGAVYDVLTWIWPF